MAQLVGTAEPEPELCKAKSEDGVALVRYIVYCITISVVIPMVYSPIKNKIKLCSMLLTS